MKLESLKASNEALSKKSMRFIVGGGNNVSGSGNYGNVSASNDYVDCGGRLWVGTHEGKDFTALEVATLSKEVCS